eukprot:g8543.t1
MGEDRSCRRDVRDLRRLCQSLSKSNEELKSAANVARVEANAWRKRASTAEKELEAERKAGAQLKRIRDTLQVAAISDKKSITRLKAELCKGAPSSRLLDRARYLKRAVEKLECQSNAQALALSAKAAELEGSRREARALAAALGAIKGTLSPGCGVEGPAAVDKLLEVGRTKLMNHDLALEMSRLSEKSEALATEKQTLEKRLSEESAGVERCRADAAELREKLEREQKEAGEQRAEASKANASAREAREHEETLRSREKKLLGDLETARGRHKELEAALSAAVERGQATGERADSLQAELDACTAALSTEKQRGEQASAQLRASNDSLHRTNQRLEKLEGVERERRRLEDLLHKERASQTCLREDVTNAREKLRMAVADRGELLRGLQQAKVFNDELAKEKEKAEEREREACARCVDVSEGKLALQRALLEHISASRAEVRDERERCQRAEATLSRFAEAAAARSRNRPIPSSRSPSENDFVTGGDEGPSAGALPPSSQPWRPRDPLVRDYLGKEGTEQFLSDWDEERSSTSSLSSSSSPSPPLSFPRPLPPHQPVAAADCLNGGSTAPLVGPKAQHHLVPGDGRRGLIFLGPPRSLPPPPPPPPPPPSSSSSPPPAEFKRRRHTGAPERGRREPPPPEEDLRAKTKICLGDPGVERWVSSMVALGKAAAARAGTGAGAGADDEAPRSARCPGDDPFLVGEQQAVREPAGDDPGDGDSSPSCPSLSSNQNTTMREGGGGSWAPPGSTHQDRRRYHQQHRQPPQRSAQRDKDRQASPPLRPELGWEGAGSDAEAGGSGDSPLLEPSPVRCP